MIIRRVSEHVRSDPPGDPLQCLFDACARRNVDREERQAEARAGSWMSRTVMLGCSRALETRASERVRGWWGEL